MVTDPGNSRSPDVVNEDAAQFIRGLSESLRDRGLGIVGVTKELPSFGVKDWEPPIGTFSADVANFVRTHIQEHNGDAQSAVEPFIELARSRGVLIELTKMNSFSENVVEIFRKERPGRAFGPDQYEELEKVIREMTESGKLQKDLSNLNSSDVIEQAAKQVGHYDDRMFAKAQAARADGLPARDIVQGKQTEITATPEQEQEQNRRPESGRGR